MKQTRPSNLEEKMNAFRTIAEEMARSGKREADIIRAFITQDRIEKKRASKKRPGMIGEILGSTGVIKPRKTPEGAIQEALEATGSTFRREYRVGQHRAAFLCGRDLVVEISGRSGPGKKEYLKQMGYRILEISERMAIEDPRGAAGMIAKKAEEKIERGKQGWPGSMGTRVKNIRSEK